MLTIVVAGSTGCRRLEGPYSLQGERISIGPTDTVGLPCEGADRRRERQLPGALESAGYWSVENDLLMLGRSSGDVVGELVRTSLV